MSARSRIVGACLWLTASSSLSWAVAAPGAVRTPPQTSPGVAVPGSQVELLHAVPSVVVVSSLVNSKTIRAEHLVDGRLDTAWNSRHGSVTDATIDFFVPAGAQVSAIRIAAGFLAKGATGDLYTQNFRITQVRVLRDGALLGDFNLDPEQRELQKIAINRAGGHFRIAVQNALAGTKANWIELCVSELEVWGTPPGGVTPRRQDPVVAVGSFHPPEGEPVADLEAYCKHEDAAILSELTSRPPPWFDPAARPQPTGPGCATSAPFCNISPPPGHSPFDSVRRYTVLHGEFPIGWERRSYLAIRAPKGWYRYPLGEGEAIAALPCNDAASGDLQGVTVTPREVTTKYVYDAAPEPSDGVTGSHSQTIHDFTCVPLPDRTPLCLQRSSTRKVPAK